MKPFHIFIALFLGAFVCAQAELPLVIVDSATDGEGVFTYTVTLPDEPYLSNVKLFQVNFELEGITEPSPEPPNWVQTGPIGFTQYKNTAPGFAPLPYSVQFTHGSSLTNSKMGTVLVSFRIYNSNNEFSITYVNVPILIPAQSGGTKGPIQNHAVYKYLPDLVIHKLLMDKGKPVGLEFSPILKTHIFVEASSDLVHWTTVADLPDFTQSPWRNETALAGSGNFFRLRMDEIPRLEP